MKQILLSLAMALTLSCAPEKAPETIKPVDVAAETHRTIDVEHSRAPDDLFQEGATATMCIHGFVCGPMVEYRVCTGTVCGSTMEQNCCANCRCLVTGTKFCLNQPGCMPLE